jgi:hypothetical protein
MTAMAAVTTTANGTAHRAGSRPNAHGVTANETTQPSEWGTST